MTKIKTWLDTNYPEIERENITDLYLNRNDLEGELELTWDEFPKLERVWYHPELNLITNFDLKIAALIGRETPKGVFLKTESRVEVKKYIPIEERLAELYPNGSRGGITKLDLTQKGLRGSLDLTDFTDLEELTLNMDCPWGRKYANSNHITGLNLGGLNILTELTLTNNSEARELGTLNALTGLEKLVLAGSKDYPARWTGSLSDIADLENLTELDISYNPAIKQGLEVFEELEKLECRGTDYEKTLKSFGGDVKAWKVIVFPGEVSEEKNKIVQKINEYLEQTKQALKELSKRQLTDLELESKVEILETRNRELLK